MESTTIRDGMKLAAIRLRRRRKRKTIKERLKEKIEAQGFEVLFLSGAQGHYRIYAYLDDTTVCWEAGLVRPNGLKKMIYSYDTMTNCVRYGFKIEEHGSNSHMVFAAVD